MDCSCGILSGLVSHFNAGQLMTWLIPAVSNTLSFLEQLCYTVGRLQTTCIVVRVKTDALYAWIQLA